MRISRRPLILTTMFARAVALLGAWLICISAVSAAFDDGNRYAFIPSANENSVLIADLREGEMAGKIDIAHRPGEIVASEIMKALVVSLPTENSLVRTKVIVDGVKCDRTDD